MTVDLETFCERQLTRLQDAGVLALFDSATPALRQALRRVVCASDFVCESLGRDPDLAKWLIGEAELTHPLGSDEMARRLAAQVGGAADAAVFMAALRRQRLREMVRIAWRDLSGVASVPQTLAETSAFADASIDAPKPEVTRFSGASSRANVRKSWCEHPAPCRAGRRWPCCAQRCRRSPRPATG